MTPRKPRAGKRKTRKFIDGGLTAYAYCEDAFVLSVYGSVVCRDKSDARRLAKWLLAFADYADSKAKRRKAK